MSDEQKIGISDVLKATGLSPTPESAVNDFEKALAAVFENPAAAARPNPLAPQTAYMQATNMVGTAVKDQYAPNSHAEHIKREPLTPAAMKAAFEKNKPIAQPAHPSPLPSSGMREMGKLPVHLVPAEFNLVLSAVLEYGAYKYAPHNFEKGMDPDDLLRGAESHLMAMKAGALYDTESGLPHAGHAAWNLLTFVMQMMREPSLEELFTSVIARRRAGNLTDVAREYAAKHSFDFTAEAPELDATEWHERVALFRNMIKKPVGQR
jgi:hypothetical protein